MVTRFTFLTLLAFLSLASFASSVTGALAQAWTGDYTVAVRGQKVFLDRTPAEEAISDTTTMKVAQTGADVVVTFGTFASAFATTALTGKVGNERICATWTHAPSQRQAITLWGERRAGVIRGQLVYPRCAGGGLVPGWTLISFEARRVAGGGQTVLRIDPAAARLEFSVVRRTTQFRGTVRILATVKNVGTEAFVSRGTGSDGMAVLYQDAAAVARLPFRVLRPAQEVQFRFERAWDSSSPAEGEFPPTYKLLLVYDPDIHLDGFPQNDDCNAANNTLTRSGTGINSLLR